MGHLGASLAPPWATLALLGPCLAHLGPTWSLWGLSWSLWGAFLAHFGRDWGPYGDHFWGHLGIILRYVGLTFASFSSFLTYRSILAFLAYLSPQKKHFASNPSGSHLGSSHHLGTSFGYAGQIVLPFPGVSAYRDYLSFSCPPIHKQFIASKPHALERPRRGREALTIINRLGFHGLVEVPPLSDCTMSGR